MGMEGHIFQGSIDGFKDVPGGMAVDWFFGEIKNLYFISHAHSDHIQGLFDWAFYPQLRPHTKIYCTEMTRNIIMRLPYYNTELDKYFVDVLLEPNETREIQFMNSSGDPTQEKMKVTTIPANHIPGAVMFLFEDDEKRALYTGDFRYDVREENSEMKALKKFVETYDEVIDYLYVDITCLDLGKLFHPDQNKFPSRQESAKTVLELLEDQKPKNIHFDLQPLGVEGLIKSVAEKLNISAQSILANFSGNKKELYKYMLELEDIKEPSREIQSETNIHIFGGSILSEDCTNCDTDTLRIRATLLWYTYLKNYSYSDPNSENTWRNYRNYKNYWQILRSNHSSDFELREFLSHLQFKKVFPISKVITPGYLGEEKLQKDDVDIKTIRKALYFSLDSPSMELEQLSSIKVLWFKLETPPVDQIDWGDKFEVQRKTFAESSEILESPSITGEHEQFDFVTIHYTAELPKNFKDYRDELRKNMSLSSETSVIFYSIMDTDGSNDSWKSDINSDLDGKEYFIDLTSEDEMKIETILLETIKNLMRNADKRGVKANVNDWPKPYEFSERKKEYEQSRQENNEQENTVDNQEDSNVDAVAEAIAEIRINDN